MRLSAPVHQDDRRWVWRPTDEQKRKFWRAWPLITLALFWFITGLGTETECVVDGNCSSGVPFTFTDFGGWGGGSSLSWPLLVIDLALFATLPPAAFFCATPRHWAARGLSAVYLLLASALIGLMLAVHWGGLRGLSIFSQRLLGG